ncbi:hypothetical protein K1719_019773 [Acacia pycnantha]|nr:hypothetical protein K1719_019773 [Acacia pycnantha]
MASNDQLMTDKEKEKKGPFFNWFYVSINIGALVAASVIVWIQVEVPDDKRLLYEVEADTESAVVGSRKLDPTLQD